MKELGNLAILCAQRTEVQMQVQNGQVSVCIDAEPARVTLHTQWDNDAEIEHIIHELNFGKYRSKEVAMPCEASRKLPERETYIKPRRDRKSELFAAVLSRAKADNGIADIEAILDYYLPNNDETEDPNRDPFLTDYHFDFAPCIQFGCEGIYVDLVLEGSFDDSEKNKLHIGTFKTLCQDKEACALMGKLCGLLMFHGHAYVNEHIHRYTPEAQLVREYEYMVKREKEGK